MWRNFRWMCTDCSTLRTEQANEFCGFRAKSVSVQAWKTSVRTVWAERPIDLRNCRVYTTQTPGCVDIPHQWLAQWDVCELVGFWTLFNVLETRKRNISESKSVSVVRWRGKTPTQLGRLERANFNHSEDRNILIFINAVFSSFYNTRRWSNHCKSECYIP
jgi:hypothetical protein